jgi:drug/metabolite transporter (DMT)-like permease
MTVPEAGGLQSTERRVFMWFICALITTLAWGAADLFYKKGADEKDKYSHLKTSMIVGFIMGGHAIATLLLNDIAYDPKNLIIYLPVSAMYILSMTVGYFGLRYLELSISSPIQNSSGAITCILCLVILGQTMDWLSAGAVILICAGVFALGLLERIKLKQDRAMLPEADKLADEKYRIGVVAFLMPILYAIVDSLGTFFDAFYLDDIDATPLVNVTEETFEDVANISYEFTFLFCGVIIFIFLMIKQAAAMKKRANTKENEAMNTLKGIGDEDDEALMRALADLDGKETVASKNTEAVSLAGEFVPLRFSDQVNRILAAVFETAGQATYVYAMSGNGVVAAPMIASYSIVSLILSRIFLKEKLTAKQYIAVAVVIAGIAVLGIVEGMAE